MVSSCWLVPLLLVEAAILAAFIQAIPVNNTRTDSALRVANMLQGPVANSAAEEFDDVESDDFRSDVDDDEAHGQITMDWLTSKLRESLPSTAPSVTVANDTTGIKQVLLLNPDVLETLESYMDSEEDLTETDDASDSTVDSTVAESQFVVRLARALKHFRYFGDKVPETVVLNSVEVIEHTNEHVEAVDTFPQGRFAEKEKPCTEPAIASDEFQPFEQPIYHRLNHLTGRRRGVIIKMSNLYNKS